MKTYINKPIIIIRELAMEDSEWQLVCERFTFFKEKFVIFSKATEQNITIEVQKISLNEFDMCSFLDFIQEIQLGSFSLTINPLKIDFAIETDRICVHID